ncbi:Uncharacterised protein [Vibrio cholerae]|nr:Uncharacterised protein [Vibrio cholerae]CSB40359.1 Uncharacterised protein [Vibrio cholerae]CSD15035.1 Uncharacterised protein [Vibrio cholerae]
MLECHYGIAIIQRTKLWLLSIDADALWVWDVDVWQLLLSQPTDLQTNLTCNGMANLSRVGSG